MVLKCKYLWTAGLLAGLTLAAGCSSDHPEGYDEQRPDVGSLSPDDRGLQSRDVLAASDQMAHDLLTDPALNQSQTQWTMAIGHFEDMTTDKTFATNYDIFLERLRTEISMKGQGRITLIENKDNFHQIRDSELDGPTDRMGQGPGGNSQPAPAAINPDYTLYGKAYDMPNIGTNFYMLEFTIQNNQTRVQVWSREYEVKVSR
jgi:hypothetical protein